MLDAIFQLASPAAKLLGYALLAAFAALILKGLYNVSPLHPLAKYPGPFLWRLSRLPASYHHASGDLYKCISAIHDKYGPTVRIAPDELTFTAPEAWPQIYNSRPQLQKTKWHFGGSDTGGFKESMITQTDAEHMRLRRLANPAFLNSGVLEVEPVMQEYTELLCSQLTKASDEGAQNMVAWLLWTLNDVIGHLALDQRFECLAKRRMHPWPSFLLGALKNIAAVNQFRRFGVSAQTLNFLMPQTMRDRRDDFVKTATSFIDERLAKEEAGVKEGKPDIVGLMLRDLKGEKLTKPEITTNSVLIVGGGAETTATCLSATIYHLCKTPRVMQKLKNEVRSTFAKREDITIRATNNMPYLKATIDEALRIFSVASYITPRTTPKQGHVINGEMIPGNTYVSMAQWHMGRSARFFDSPKEFRPERWLAEDGGDAAARSSIEDTLRPFSLGPRNCIGKLLALAEAKLVISKLLWHFDMELDGEHATWVEDARFYILWQLQPLNVKLTPVQRK